jgi:hypothetical protein
VPDENKFAKLRDVGYVVPITCGMCIHGEFPSKGSPWGTCGLHQYEHKKHANPEGGRGVSIHASGTCPSAEVDGLKAAVLGAHREFLR